MSLCRINRAQILDDSFNLARADLLDYPTALANTEYLILETDFIPWSSALTGFSYLENMMKRSPGFGDLKTYLLATLQPLYNRLGFQARRIKFLFTSCDGCYLLIHACSCSVSIFL